MKVIVTGGTGYIGSHTIIEILEHSDFTPVSIDNFSKSEENTLSRIKEITGKTVKNYPIDLTHSEHLREVFKQEKNIVGIIHFAAFKSVPESVQEPLLYYRNNLESLINVLSIQEEFNIPHFIFSSSCSVYGNANHLPVTEAAPFAKAESPYAHTKQIGEGIIENFISKKKNSSSAVSLRYFNPVGAHMSGKNGELPLGVPDNLVPFITQTAIGKRDLLSIFGGDYPTRDGTCVRDYIHVSDIARAHLDALNYLIKNKSVRYNVFNLGTGNGISVLESVKTFEKVTGLRLNYKIGDRRPGDVVEIYADNTKARQVLGWVPKYSLEDMMKSAWLWEQNLANEYTQ